MDDLIQTVSSGRNFQYLKLHSSLLTWQGTYCPVLKNSFNFFMECQYQNKLLSTVLKSHHLQSDVTRIPPDFRSTIYRKAFYIVCFYGNKVFLGYDSSVHTQHILEETVWNLYALSSVTCYSMLCNMSPTKKYALMAKYLL